MWLVLYVFLPAEQSMRAVRHVEMSLLNMAGVCDLTTKKNYQYARIVPVDSGVNILLLFMLLLLL